MNHIIARILTGSLIIIFGLGSLLDALQVLPFWANIGTWWPIGLILIGGIILINNLNQFIWATIFIGSGALLQLERLGLVEVNFFALFWPVIIIGIGLSILFQKTMRPKNIKVQDLDDLTAIFGGSETVNSSKNYLGGKASAIFGGVTIDLRDAVIKKEATLNVFALCGGIELKVPREWKIKTEVFPILGGVESKSSSTAFKDDAPLLIVTGTAALGGIEIRS
jgi:predicted membrane protein